MRQPHDADFDFRKARRGVEVRFKVVSARRAHRYAIARYSPQPPQPPSRWRIPPLPMRIGFIMTRHLRCVQYRAIPPCFNRLRIYLFISYTSSSFPCHQVAVSHKPSRIFAQLPLPVSQPSLRRYLSALHFHHFITVFAYRFFVDPF